MNAYEPNGAVEFTYDGKVHGLKEATSKAYLALTPDGKKVNPTLYDWDYGNGNTAGLTNVADTQNSKDASIVNVEAKGKAGTVCEGQGNASQKINGAMKINPKKITGTLTSSTKIRATYTVPTYTGKALTPPISLYDTEINNQKIATSTTTYSNNKDAGTNTAKANITVIDPNYVGVGKSGVNTATWSINQATPVYTKVASGGTYDGNTKTPATTLTGASNTTLKQGTDYKVTYANNKNAGKETATATIASMVKNNANKISNYTMPKTVVKKFTISWKPVAVPKAVTGLKYTGKSQTGVKSAYPKIYTVSSNTGTNAKSYTAKATISNSNYTFTKGSYVKTASISWSISSAAAGTAWKTFNKYSSSSPATAKATDLKKAAKTYAVSAYCGTNMKWKDAKTTTYAKKSGSSCLTVASNGTVTLKKGTKAGTYNITVTGTAKSSDGKTTKAITSTLYVKVS